MSTRQRLAGLVWAGVWLFPLVSPLSTATTTVAVAGLALFAVVYTLVAWAAFESIGTRRLRLAGLGLLTVLGLALSTSYGPEWLMLLVYVGSCGTAVCTPANRPTAAVVLGTLTAVVVVGWAKSDGVGTVAVTAFGTFLASAAVYAVRQMSNLIAELRSTREALAASAVEQERLRFSRDLHDLLGQTLSLVVVKAEAVRRLVPSDPVTAAAQARDIEEVGRRALAEVREAVAGYRGAGLVVEIAQARRVLAAADIALTVTLPPASLPSSVDILLAWVVREAATNVVRHSRAKRCDIDVTLATTLATVEIRDDGVGPPPAPALAGPAPAPPPGHGPVPGTGLTGLRERLTAAGGSLVAGAGPAGGFRVLAQAPMPDVVPA